MSKAIILKSNTSTVEGINPLIPVSPDVTNPGNYELTPLAEVLESIRSTDYKKQVTVCRKIFAKMSEESDEVEKKKLKAQYKAEKLKLPVVYLNARFNGRILNKNFTEVTGLIIIDLDKFKEKGFTTGKVKGILKKKLSVAFCFISPSGDGLKVGVCIEVNVNHYSHYKEQVFEPIKGMFEGWGLGDLIDDSGCDIRRACFESHDTSLYYNPDAAPLPLDDYAPLSVVESVFKPKQTTPVEVVADELIFDDAEIIKMLKHINPGCPYDDWLKVLMGLHHHNPALLEIADQWSSTDEKYKGTKDLIKKWDSFNHNNVDPVAIGSVIAIARNGGYIMDWLFEPLVRLKEVLLPVQKFPIKALPESVKAWVIDEAERMGAPVDFVATCVLITLSAIIGKKITVMPKKEDKNWEVVVNLWGSVIGDPSVLKSPSLKASNKFINAIEDENKEIYKEKMAQYQKDKATYDLILGEAQKKVKKILAGEDSSEKERDSEANRIMSAAMDKEPKKPVLKQFIINNATIEALQIIMGENTNGVLYTYDELSAFMAKLNDKKYQTDRAFMLETWDGSGSHVINRVGRDRVCIDNCIASVQGGIQPSKLISYMEGVSKGDGQFSDGLMQRFQLSTFPDVGKLKVLDRKRDEAAYETAMGVFESVTNLETGVLSSVSFTDDAQLLFNAFHQDVKDRGMDEETHGMQAHLGKYPSLCPSLALILQIANGAGIVANINVESTQKAIDLCEYYESHARRIYAMSEGYFHRAEELIGKLSTLDKPEGFTIRDVVRSHWKHLSTQGMVESAIETLVEHGYIAVLPKPSKTTGRPTKKYIVNPDSQDTHN